MQDLFYMALVEGDHVIAWVAAFVVGLIGKWVIAKIDSERVRKYVGRALDEVYDAVGEVWQTYVKGIKEGASDGKLTIGEKRAAKAKAIATARANIGKEGLARLTRILGTDALDGWLATKVESTVTKFKNAGAVKVVKNGDGPLS